MANQLAKHYDLVISGGGIVGFTLLNTLLKSPLINRCNILLIEQADKYGSKKLQSSELSDEDKSTAAKESTVHEPKYSNRVSSLTLSTRHFLKKLGVWEHLETHAKKVKSIRTWNYDYNHKIEFNPSTHYKYNGQNYVNEENILFNVVENRRIGIALSKNLEISTKNISSCPDKYIAWNSVVESVLHKDDGTIEIKGKNSETGEEFTTNTPFIVGCDGFKSTVREAAGFEYYEQDLNKTAIVGTVEMENRHSGDMNDISYQRFSASTDTVAALLPLDGQFSSFVISAPTSYANKLMNTDEESFIEEFNYLLNNNEVNNNLFLKSLHEVGNLSMDIMDSLNKKLSVGFNNIKHNLDQDFWHDFDDTPPRLNRLVSGSRAAYPLHFGTTSPYMVRRLPGGSRKQIALIGDASHRVHPLAGQGLNLGIIDAMILSEELEMAAKNGENLFNQNDLYALERALNNFQQRRQIYIMPMMASIYAMPTIFNLAPARALTLFNSFDCVKDATVNYAN